MHLLITIITLTCSLFILGKFDYVWAQTDTDVTVWFRLPEDSRKDDAIVDISVHDIHIEYKKQVMLDGNFFDGVKAEESIWTVVDGT
jgi:hypothetical protein